MVIELMGDEAQKLTQAARPVVSPNYFAGLARNVIDGADRSLSILSQTTPTTTNSLPFSTSPRSFNQPYRQNLISFGVNSWYPVNAHYRADQLACSPLPTPGPRYPSGLTRRTRLLNNARHTPCASRIE